MGVSVHFPLCEMTPLFANSFQRPGCARTGAKRCARFQTRTAILTLRLLLSAVWLSQPEPNSCQAQPLKQAIVKPSLELTGFSGEVRVMAFSTDGKALAIAADDSFVIPVFDLKSGNIISRLHGHSDQIRALTFSNDGTLMASGGMDKSIRIWDIRKQETRTKILAPINSTLVFSPDSKVLCAGCLDTSEGNRFFGICLWTVEGRVLKKVPINDIHSALAYSQGGRYLAMVSSSVCLYDTVKDEIRHLPGRIMGTTRAVGFINEDSSVYVGGRDHRIRVWDVAPDRRDQFALHEDAPSGCSDRILSAIYIPDKGVIETCSTDGILRVWDPKQRRLTRKVSLVDSKDLEFMPWKAAFSKSGTHLAVQTIENHVLIINIAEAKD
jgi:WD40 repeat protein